MQLWPKVIQLRWPAVQRVPRSRVGTSTPGLAVGGAATYLSAVARTTWNLASRSGTYLSHLGSWRLPTGSFALRLLLGLAPSGPCPLPVPLCLCARLR